MNSRLTIEQVLDQLDLSTDNQDWLDSDEEDDPAGPDGELCTSDMDPLDQEQASLPDSSTVDPTSQLLLPPDSTATPPAVTLPSQVPPPVSFSGGVSPPSSPGLAITVLSQSPPSASLSAQPPICQHPVSLNPSTPSNMPSSTTVSSSTNAPASTSTSSSNTSTLPVASTAIIPASLEFASGIPPFSESFGPTTLLPGVTASPVDFFELFFSTNVIDHIVAQTNLYANQNPPSPSYEWERCTHAKLKSFLGLCILMGLKRVPSLPDYWSTTDLLGCPELIHRWPYRIFRGILTCLHLNDNSVMLPPTDPNFDRLFKVRPLLDMIRDNCIKQYHPSRCNSIDEAMVGFKGRIGFKQYLPLKPTKRGYKVWCRADSYNGYLCDFSVYTGKKTNSPSNNSDLGQGGMVVKDLSSILAGKGYFLFFDNFFSSISLLENLEKDLLFCCSTTRPNRLRFPDQLKNLRLSVGEYQRALVGSTEAIVWKDKRNVCFLNNIYSERGTTVKRKQRDGSTMNVSCPTCVKGYNMHMGGVDQADQKRKSYSCSRKSEKWWCRIFWFLLDISVVNAHILSQLTPGFRQLSQKEFRVELGTALLEQYSCRKRMWLRASSVPMPTHHQIVRVKKQRRCHKCGLQGKRKMVLYICKECNIGLHPECFHSYHFK